MSDSVVNTSLLCKTNITKKLDSSLFSRMLSSDEVLPSSKYIKYESTLVVIFQLKCRVWFLLCRNRSSHQRCSVKKVFLEISQNFTNLRPATLLKKRLWHRCFPVNFVKFLRTPFLQNNSARLLL